MRKRDIGVFLRDLLRKPPAPFPYIAGFDLLMIVFVLLFWWGEPFTYYYVELLWTLGFAFCWIYVCLLKRWAAYGYLGLTLANVVLFLVSMQMDGFERDIFQKSYISALWLPALLFSFFILFFFRRLKDEGIDVPKL